jgi:serine/threonine protein kinase
MRELELQEFELLWNRYNQRLEREPSLQLEEFARDHPDTAEDILRLFPTMRIMTDLSKNALNPQERIGEYSIVRQIGIGGMGIVYEATCETLRERIAIKVVEPAQLLAGGAKRFAREARMAAMLHHSHIVPIYEYGEIQGQPYYTMRLISGPNLAVVLHEDWSEIDEELSVRQKQSRVIAQRLAGNWTWQAELIIDVGAALAHAHKMGVLHRDVKPANLIFDENDKLWVSDFGLARQRFDLQRMSIESKVLGTPRYMAPEQIRGEGDERSDVFGLGLVLYEMALLSPDSRRERRNIWRGGLKAPRELNPSIPDDLERIILKAVSLNPCERYPSVSDMIEELNAFRGRSKQVPLEDSRRGKRNTILGIALIFGAVLVGLGLRNSSGSALPSFTETQISSNNEPPSFDEQMFGGDGRTVMVDAASIHQALALQIHDDHSSAYSGLVVAVSGGRDRDRIGMTPPGVFVFTEPALIDLKRTNSQRTYEIEVSATDQTRAYYARLEEKSDGRIVLIRETLQPGASLATEVFPGDYCFRRDIIDIATADGVTFYHIHADGEGTAALFSSQYLSDGKWKQTLLQADCGIPQDAIGFATNDGRTFDYLCRSDSSQLVVWWRASLERNSIFHCEKYSEDCGMPPHLRGFSSLDAGRYHHISHTASGASRFFFSFSANGRFSHMPLNDSTFDYKSIVRGQAAWTESELDAKSTRRKIYLVVKP